jgi:copper chaperone CopZ
MKTSKLLALTGIFGAAAFLAIAADAPAPTTYSVTLSDVHLCCGNCVKGVTTALAPVTGVTGVSDQAKKTVVITAPDKATAQKAVDALTAAGFYGTSSDSAIKVSADTGAKADKVSSLEISEVHLCCAKCVTGVKAALKDVPGYSDTDAKPNAKTFTVTGDFKPTDVFAALQKAGFTGKAGATKPEAAPAASSAKT